MAAKLPKSHTALATLKLSGEEVIVGFESSPHDSSSIFFQNQFMEEPHYLSPLDAKLFIAALKVAVAEVTGANE